MTRNGGKLVAPLRSGALILVVSPAVAFAAVGVSTWLARSGAAAAPASSTGCCGSNDPDLVPIQEAA